MIFRFPKQNIIMVICLDLFLEELAGFNYDCGFSTGKPEKHGGLSRTSMGSQCGFLEVPEFLHYGELPRIHLGEWEVALFRDEGWFSRLGIERRDSRE